MDLMIGEIWLRTRSWYVFYPRSSQDLASKWTHKCPSSHQFPFDCIMTYLPIFPFNANVFQLQYMHLQMNLSFCEFKWLSSNACFVHPPWATSIIFLHQVPFQFLLDAPPNASKSIVYPLWKTDASWCKSGICTKVMLKAVNAICTVECGEICQCL